MSERWGEEGQIGGVGGGERERERVDETVKREEGQRSGLEEGGGGEAETERKKREVMI